MSEETIDLTLGEPDESPSRRRRRARREEGSSSSSTTSAPSDRENKSLTGRLETAFDKIADQLVARGDNELATAIRDEKKPMSQGLVSLTAAFTPFRPFLVLLLALMEPFLAFWRVGRILFYRFLAWRERRITEQQMAAEEMNQQEGTVPSSAYVG